MAKKADIQCSDCDALLKGKDLECAAAIDDERVICVACQHRRALGRRKNRYYLDKLDELYAKIPKCGQTNG